MQSGIVGPSKWCGTVTEWEISKGEGTITVTGVEGWPDDITVNVHREFVVPDAAPWRVDNKKPILEIGDKVNFEAELWALNVRHEPKPKPTSRSHRSSAAMVAKDMDKKVKDNTKDNQKKKPVSAKTKKAVMKVMKVMKKPVSAKTKASAKTKK
jgi:hypothetical protein